MPKVGERFDPPHGVAWSDGNSDADPPRGYYPLREDGKTFDDSIRLRYIDDEPDTEFAAGHFEVMRREAGFGYFHGVGSGEKPPGPQQAGGAMGVSAPAVVPLQANVQGEASAEANPFRPLNKIRYLLRR